MIFSRSSPLALITKDTSNTSLLIHRLTEFYLSMQYVQSTAFIASAAELVMPPV